MRWEDPANLAHGESGDAAASIPPPRHCCVTRCPLRLYRRSAAIVASSSRRHPAAPASHHPPSSCHHRPTSTPHWQWHRQHSRPPLLPFLLPFPATSSPHLASMSFSLVVVVLLLSLPRLHTCTFGSTPPSSTATAAADAGRTREQRLRKAVQRLCSALQEDMLLAHRATQANVAELHSAVRLRQQQLAEGGEALQVAEKQLQQFQKDLGHLPWELLRRSRRSGSSRARS